IDGAQGHSGLTGVRPHTPTDGSERSLEARSLFATESGLAQLPPPLKWVERLCSTTTPWEEKRVCHALSVSYFRNLRSSAAVSWNVGSLVSTMIQREWTAYGNV